MKKGWTTTKLMATGGFAVLAVILWLPSAIILSTTGNPLGVLFGLFIGPFISVLTILTVREFGALTLSNFIGGIIGLPTPSVAPKLLELINMLVRSFFVDVIFHFLKTKEKLASIICGGAHSSLISLFTYLIYLLIGVPGAEKVPSIILTPLGVVITLIIIFFMGNIGGYLAYVIYKKIENTNIVKRIQGG